MPLLRRLAPQSRHGLRRYDAASPLYVLRRIASGSVDGAPTFLAAGSVFDPAGINPMRLRTLFANRYIGHEQPRALRRQPAPAAPTVAVLEQPPAAPAVALAPVEPPPPVALPRLSPPSSGRRRGA